MCLFHKHLAYHDYATYLRLGVLHSPDDLPWHNNVVIFIDSSGLLCFIPTVSMFWWSDL